MRPNNAQLQSPLLTTFLTVMALAAPKAAAYSNNTKTLGGPRVKWLVQHWPFVRRAQNGKKCSKTESQGLSLYLACITPPLVLLGTESKNQNGNLRWHLPLGVRLVDCPTQLNLYDLDLSDE